VQSYPSITFWAFTACFRLNHTFYKIPNSTCRVSIALYKIIQPLNSCKEKYFPLSMSQAGLAVFRIHSFINKYIKKIANGVIRDAVCAHRLHKGVLHSQSVIRFHGTQGNEISLSPIRNIRLFLRRFSRNSKIRYKICK
jgi:hypothetical protein